MKRLFNQLFRRRPSSRQAVKPTSALDAQAGYYGYFEGTKHTRERTRIPYFVGDAKSTHSGLERLNLISTARWLYDNDGLVKGAINDLARYSFPLKVQAASAETEWNAQAEELFAEWSDYADITSTLSFEEIQRLSSIAIDRDGDIGIAFVQDGERPALQLIEAHRIKDAPRNGSFVEGVQTDAFGRPLAFSVSDDSTSDGFREVSANSMVLLADPDRLDQRRGLSSLRHAIAHIRDKHDIVNFEKQGVKNLSTISAVIESELGEADTSTWDFETTTDASGNDLTVAKMQSGAIPVLPKGDKLSAFQGNRPSAAFTGFLEFLVREFAIGMGLPYEFVWEPKGITGPAQRFIMNKAQRRFRERQRLLEPVIKRTWAFVIANAIEAGQLPAVAGWERTRLQPPASLTIDAGRDAMQEREDVKAGLLTLQEHYGKRGLDWEQELEQAGKEVETIFSIASDIATRSGVPVEQVLNRLSMLTQHGETPPPPNNEAPT